MSAIAVSAAELSALTRRMLAEPILPTLLRMAWPNVLVMVLQSTVGLIETYFVGRLGTSALAGVSLVFPMTMMSAGVLGGGISSWIARALGARDTASAERFAGHAIAVSLLAGRFGFGFGAPLVAIVGTNLGAGNVERAYRAAWIGAAIAFAIAETAGLLVAIFPHRWIGLFDTAPDVIAAGSIYLQRVGPFYGLFGAAIVLNLAFQGAQRVMWPFLAGSARLLVAAGGGWLAAARFGASLETVSLLVAVGVALFGGINIAAVWARTWTRSAPGFR